METEFRLCRMILPPDSRAGQETMYYRKKGKIQRDGDMLLFAKGAEISSDTYFNGFVADTWRTYACPDRFFLRILLYGKFRFRLCRMFLRKDKVIHQVLLETDVSHRPRKGKEAAVCDYALPPKQLKGEILYFELQAQAEGSRMDGAEYFALVSADRIRPVRLAVGICTYKREACLLKNLALLSDKLAQPESPLYGHAEIFVADNGHTLGDGLKKFPLVHGFVNPNLGGAAGFARCMLEVLRMNEAQAGFTHILLMDDDVQVEWSSIEKTYALLCLRRTEYRDAYIAGAMLRADQPYLQEESAGVFTKYGNQPLHSGLDMRKRRDCLKNNEQEYADYGAWWYCCFPVRMLYEVKFPLPLFIHGDDVEWGLRGRKTLIRMNGICVWHEPLDGKVFAERVYYNIRNLFICQALYGARTAGLSMAVLLWKQFFHDAFLHQYQCVCAGLLGAEDFLKGPAFLKETDAQKLHQMLLALRGTGRDISLLRRKIPWNEIHAAESYRPGRLERIWKALLLNGCFLPGGRTCFVPQKHFSFAFAWHSRRLVFVDEKSRSCYVRNRSRRQFLKYFCRTVRVSLQLAGNYHRAAEAYRIQAADMQTREFWEAYLKLSEMQSPHLLHPKDSQEKQK